MRACVCVCVCACVRVRDGVGAWLVGWTGRSVAQWVCRYIGWVGVHRAHNVGHQRPTSDTPSQWPVAGGPLVARLVC